MSRDNTLCVVALFHSGKYREVLGFLFRTTYTAQLPMVWVIPFGSSLVRDIVLKFLTPIAPDQMFHNKKTSISVLAFITAVGSNVSCQRSQSIPNKSEKLIGIPNGKDKEVHSVADGPSSSISGRSRVMDNEGVGNTPSSLEASEQDSSDVNNNREGDVSKSLGSTPSAMGSVQDTIYI